MTTALLTIAEYDKLFRICRAYPYDSKEQREASARIRADSEERKRLAVVMQPPEGFEPVLQCESDGITIFQATDAFTLPITDTSPRRLTFSGSPEEMPKLPLRFWSECKHQGWDIPTQTVMDADGQCWADNAHGHALTRCGVQDLLNLYETEGHFEVSDRIRALCGRKPGLPDWVRSARANGWTPPASFNYDDYED